MLILLIEDETEHCKLYQDYIATVEKIQLLTIADCEQAVFVTLRRKPDVVLLDLEMHYGYGDGLLYLNKLNMMEEANRPIIIVITKSPSENTHNITRALGADCIFFKKKPDYSAQMVVDFAITAYERLGGHKPFAVQHAISIPTSNALRDKISAAIAPVGITHDVSGRVYIIDAIEIALNHKSNKIRVTRDIYPAISAKYGRSAISIDSAISTAIKKAWRETHLSVLQKYYKAHVSYETGAPSNKEFICFFRDRLRA